MPWGSKPNWGLTKIKKPTGDVETFRETGYHSFIDAQKIRAAKDVLKKLPVQGETIHWICRSQFTAWSVVPAILDLSGGIIEEIYISTMTFNEKNLLHLVTLFDEGRIRKINLICSVHFKAMNPKQYAVGFNELTKRQQQITEILNHSKTICCRMQDANHYVLETSSNLRGCSSFEHYALTNSQGLFAYHRDWQEREFQNAK